MSFGDILGEWEKRKIGVKQDRKALESWIDRYPPPAEAERDADQNETTTEPFALRRLRPQRQLDLHGLRVAEVDAALDAFVDRCRRDGVRKALIVHGKGLHSAEEPVLGRKVREYLERSPHTGAWGRASREQGGSGAVWVVIRQSARVRKK